MFDEREYREVFSKVTASDETHRRILHMAKQKKRTPVGRRMVVLIAAVITLIAVSVTALATESITSWFRDYFASRSDAPLTQQQEAYLDANTQQINEKHTIDEWTVELRSVIHDGTTAYMIFGVTAPEDVSLEQPENGHYTPGNVSMKGSERADIITSSEGLILTSANFAWEEDYDGLTNTKNYVIQMIPDKTQCASDPFGNSVEWYIHIENLIWEYEDTEYKQELMNGKYYGQTNVMFTSAETSKLYKEEILADGAWDFTINFAQHTESVELLTNPVNAMAYAHHCTGTSIDDVEIVYEEVSIDSFIINPLTALIHCNQNSVDFADNEDSIIWVVMKDDTMIQLRDYGATDGKYCVLEAATPIILDDVAYILLPDGTRIPMP